MDYKEKYEKVLSQAKQAMENIPDKALADWLKEIFPELKEKESEDGKIRKEILSVIEQIDENTTICGRKYDYRKWIAWLEKQGEAVSDPRCKYLDELLVADDIHQMAMNDAMIEEAKEKAIKALSKLGISKLILEKHEVQKFVEQYPATNIEEQLEERRIKPWKEYLYDKQLRWSEEDEVRFEEALGMIEANGGWVRSQDSVKLVSNWLKSIKQRMKGE